MIYYGQTSGSAGGMEVADGYGGWLLRLVQFASCEMEGPSLAQAMEGAQRERGQGGTWDMGHTAVEKQRPSWGPGRPPGQWGQ